MNQSPTPQIKLIHIFLSQRDAAKYPWRKEVAELRHDLAAADGYTVNPAQIAKELAISPEQIANLESGGWSTDAEGWRRFEAAVRKVHEAVGKAREARANVSKPVLPVIALAVGVALSALGCGPENDPESKCEAAGGSYECDGIIRPDGAEHCFCDMSK